MSFLLDLLSAAQAFALLASAYYSYEIYKYNRLAKVWLAFTAGMGLLGLDSLVVNFVLRPTSSSQSTATFLHVVLTFGYFLVLGGVRSMAQTFEGFEHVERKVGQKAAEFNRRRKRR